MRKKSWVMKDFQREDFEKKRMRNGKGREDEE